MAELFFADWDSEYDEKLRLHPSSLMKSTLPLSSDTSTNCACSVYAYIGVHGLSRLTQTWLPPAMPEDAIDYPKRGQKKRKRRGRKRPQRRARSSGSVPHTDAAHSECSSHAPPGEESTNLDFPISQNELSTENLINLNSPPPGQYINGLMATLNITWIKLFCHLMSCNSSIQLYSET